MAHKERIKAVRTILEIPKGWNLGAISTARDDIVWYQVWRDGATPPATPLGQGALSLNGGTLTLTSNTSLAIGQLITVTQDSTVVMGVDTLQLEPGAYTWNGTTFDPVQPSDERLHTVPTLAGGTASVVESTPHVYDGVENGAYRYLGVKRGTILIGGSASTVAQPKWTATSTPILALPANVDLRIAGYDRAFHMSSHYDAVPAGGPKVKALAVDGGAIWLPTDGSEPYFSTGTR
jgi:hypothetical protein